MHYGAELARIHDAHFGMVARGAARELLTRLSQAGITAGRVVDLATGSGILSHAVVEAGLDAWGLDISEDMLAIARERVPSAELAHGSLWSAPLPRCVAVAAVGEAMSYATDQAASLSALEERLAVIHEALVPGGLLLLDVAGPGRSGPRGSRSIFWGLDGAYLGMREEEQGRRITRTITMFLPEGDTYRRVEEHHALVLYAPEEVEGCLANASFVAERLPRYGDFALPEGWHAWVARRG